ncbi:MAG: thrombospondin type 3 repeat-containing protein [Lentisphaerota bacterium]
MKTRLAFLCVMFSILTAIPTFAGTVKIEGGSAYATIQAAVDAAVSGDRILISTGVFFEAVLVSGKDLELRGGYDEGLVARPGGFTGLTSSNLSSIIWFNNSSSRVDQVNFFNGIANIGTLYCGGGCVMNQSWVEFTDSSMFGNQAIYGGGLFVDELSHAILIGGSRIYDNIALWRGGGAHVKGWLDILNEDCDIYRNVVSNGHGGGLFLENASLHASQGDIFDNATAGLGGVQPAGGGIGAVNSELILGGGMLISNNMAGWGGGISMLESTAYLGNATAEDVKFIRNTAIFGGGLQAWSSEIHSQGTSFRDNAVTFSGGAGCLLGSYFSSDTNLLIASKNFATLEGGGFYLGTCTADLQTVDFGYGPVYGNSAGINGGGLYITNSEVFIYGGQFIGNKSGIISGLEGHGAAIAAFRSGLMITAGPGRYGSFTNVYFGYNDASNYCGGAVYLSDDSHANFYSSMAQGNLASEGGMLYVSPTCNYVMVHCVVTGNVAMTNGGAISARGDGTVTDCRFLNNAAGLAGGGIYVTECSVEASKSSFIRNRAGIIGGGVFGIGHTYINVNTPPDTQAYTASNGWTSLFFENRPDALVGSYYSRATILGVAFVSNNLMAVDFNLSSYDVRGTLIDEYAGFCFSFTSATGSIGNCTLYGSINMSDHCVLAMTNSIAIGSINTNENCLVTLDYCDTPNAWPGVGNITNYPVLFGNYHQMHNSPTRNTGAPVDDPFLRDIDGELRFGSASDIGCDEYVDDDNDHLPNIMETGTGHIDGDFAMGSNPSNPDSDGDGYLDGDEWAADTDPNQSGSCLRFIQMKNEDSSLQLYWQGGMRVYQYLEGCTNILSDEWYPITSFTPPTAIFTNYPVNNWIPNMHYRIRTYR